MRKATFLAMTLICGVAFTNCAAKKSTTKQQTAQNQQSDMDRKLDSLKKTQEYNKILMQMKLDSINNAAAISAATMNANNAIASQDMYIGQNVHVPCFEYSIDKKGEYMAAFGIATDQIDMKDAQDKAWASASADIVRRFLGVVTNGSSMYIKDVNTRNSQKVKESELEGEAINVCQKAINKYMEPACRKVQMDSHGNFSYYVAAQVSIAKVLDEIINEQDVITVEADRARWREFMQKELDKQAAAKEAEKESMLKQYQELSK